MLRLLLLLAACSDATSTAGYVDCGGTICAKGLTCCLAIPSGTATYTCSASCPDALALECDGPEDCPNGNCCSTYTIQATVPAQPVCAYVGSFACVAACQTTDNTGPGCTGGGVDHLCRSSADCNHDSGNPACCGGGEFPSRCVTTAIHDSILGAGGSCY